MYDSHIKTWDGKEYARRGMDRFWMNRRFMAWAKWSSRQLKTKQL